MSEESYSYEENKAVEQIWVHLEKSFSIADIDEPTEHYPSINIYGEW